MMHEGQYLMQLGQDKVKSNNKIWMSKMISLARAISLNDGRVSTDELHKYTDKIGQPNHPNAWGAIFKNRKENTDGKWTFVGTKRSDRKEAHARRINIWQYQYSSLKYAEIASQFMRLPSGRFTLGIMKNDPDRL